MPPEPPLAFAHVSAADALARVDALVTRFRTLRAAGRILPNSVEAVRVELTYHSNAIEGSTLTLRDTQLVIEGREPNTGKSLREIYEARNHDRALRMVEGWAETRPADSLTARDLLAVHREVLADIYPAGTGRVLITGGRFVPLDNGKFPYLVPALLERANRPGVHAVIQAAELHYNLLAAHSYQEGDGPTARLLMNHHLLRHGFPHAVIPVERRAEYLVTLLEANAGRCGPFAAFVLQCVEDSTRWLIGDDPDE